MLFGTGRRLILLFAAFTFSAFASCGNSADRSISNFQTTAVAPTVENGQKRININTAPEEELARLPIIGPKIASQIVEYRTQYGPFRRIEHLMLIQGVSEKRFREIKDLIKVE